MRTINNSAAMGNNKLDDVVKEAMSEVTKKHINEDMHVSVIRWQISCISVFKFDDMKYEWSDSGNIRGINELGEYILPSEIIEKHSDKFLSDLEGCINRLYVKGVFM